MYLSRKQDQKSQNLTPHVGCSKSGCYNQKHPIPAWCRGPAHQHEACREWWSKSTSHKSQTALPAHGPMSQQFSKDGLDNIWLSKSQFGACIDSGASWCYSPDCNAFINYSPISNTTITTANGCKPKVLGKGDEWIKLPNSVKCTMLWFISLFVPLVIMFTYFPILFPINMDF